LASAGVTSIDINILAFTVKTAKLLVMPPKVAVMFDVPAVKPIAKPLIGAAATAWVAEAQVMPGFAVTLRVDPSLYVAVAVNCWVPRTGIEASAGVTVSCVSVLATTVKTAILLVMPSNLAVMFDGPELKPVAKPLFGSRATRWLLELQTEDAVTSMDEPSLYIAVAVNCWKPVIGIKAVGGVTFMDVNVRASNQCPV